MFLGVEATIQSWFRSSPRTNAILGVGHSLLLPKTGLTTLA